AFQSSLFRFSVACPLPPGADKVDSAEGMARLEAMSSHHNFRPGQQNKLVSEPPIAAPDEHAQLVEADQRFRAALCQAIAAGGDRIGAAAAKVQLKRPPPVGPLGTTVPPPKASHSRPRGAPSTCRSRVLKLAVRPSPGSDGLKPLPPTGPLPGGHACPHFRQR